VWEFGERAVEREPAGAEGEGEGGGEGGGEDVAEGRGSSAAGRQVVLEQLNLELNWNLNLHSSLLLNLTR
jgi:hypothetical protein